MARMEVHGVDFPPGTGHYRGGLLILPVPDRFFGEKIPEKHLVSVEVVTQESAVLGSFSPGRALVGELLLGPLGLLAGAGAATLASKITFMARLADKRRLLATTDMRTFNRLLAASLKYKPRSDEADSAAEAQESTKQADALVSRYVADGALASPKITTQNASAEMRPTHGHFSHSVATPVFGKRR